jgi:hypothetical protein
MMKALAEMIVVQLMLFVPIIHLMWYVYRIVTGELVP